MYEEKCLLRLGSNIKILRNASQITQAELARRIGISQTHLCNIEHNNVQISLKLLLRVANVLGCSLECIIGVNAVTIAKRVEAQCKVKSEPVRNEDKNTAKQEVYSLEEILLLLRLLQLS